jgi:hypothetical protein
VTTPISMQLDDEGTLQRYMCQEYANDSFVQDGASHDPGVYPAQFPAPNDPNLTCTYGGKMFTVATVSTQTGALCDPVTTVKHTEAYSLPTGQPAPAGWPCPLTSTP